MKPFLLLVDLQNDYLAAPGLVPPAGEVVEKAALLLRECRLAGVPVAHVWTSVNRSNDLRMPHWKRSGRWICEEGTSGHDTPEALRPIPGEPVVRKRFFSAFSGGDLAPLLSEAGVDTLLLCGIHLHGCIRETILDAYEMGFEVLVADDAVASDDPLHASTTRRYLQSRAARFPEVDVLLPFLRMLRAASGPVDFHPPEEQASGSVLDVSEATGRARSAFSTWAGSPVAARKEVLERASGLIERRADEFALLMARVIGKPVAYGAPEVRDAAALLRDVAGRAVGQPGGETFIGARRRPLGVIAAITPWNNPFLIPLGKIAAAIFHGNTVVWKPSPLAGCLADPVLECLRLAGLPENVVTVLQGGRQTSERLMSDPLIDAVTLTGGALAGYCALDICARRHIPLQAELGGSNAAIIWKDADLPSAAELVAEGAFGFAGQRCTANRRVVVHQDCAGEFLSLLGGATARLAWGEPSEAGTRVGPMVNEKQRDRVAALIRRSASACETVPVHMAGDAAAETRAGAAFYPPTILRCENPRHEIVQEETFGPVLVVQTASGWDEAISLCNGTRHGLAAAVFTSSEEIMRRFLEEARAGILKINEATTGVAPHLPFGGWKASGIGPPEHGAADCEFYTRFQAVYFQGKPSGSEGLLF